MRRSRLDYEFYIYLLASLSGTLYVGVTDDIARRFWEHKHDKIEGFSKRYQCHKLVYYECYQYIDEAIRREKQLKRWNRKKKEWLIKRTNPHWEDLAKDWYKF